MTEYTSLEKIRLQKLEELRAEGVEAYPTRAKRTHTSLWPIAIAGAVLLWLGAWAFHPFDSQAGQPNKSAAAPTPPAASNSESAPAIAKSRIRPPTERRGRTLGS